MNLKLLRLSFLALFLPFLQNLNAQCEYTLQMFDAFGDGWNGGELTVTNGSTVYNFTLDNINDDGIDSTLTFVVTNGAPLNLSWSSGVFDTEVSFIVYDYDGNIIYQDDFPGNGSLYSGFGFCPDCLKPTKVKIENVYDTRAKLRWTPVSLTPSLGWWVIYGPKGFNLGSGVGDSVFVTLPKVQLTGLAKKTDYDFYVLELCDSTEYSGIVGPYSFQTYWSNDVGISAVLTPESGCDLGVEKVTITMQNYGANPQSLIPFRFTVNGFDAGVPQPQDGFYTGVLGKDSLTTIEFETTYDFSEPGEYVIKVFTQMTGDEDVLNDTAIYRIVNRLLAPYYQDFETWEGGWYVDTASTLASWEFGVPNTTNISTAASGKNAWVTNLDGNYNNGEKSYLTSPCFDFTDLTEDPVIEFAINYFTELNFDGGYLEVSTDNGQVWKKAGLIGEGLNWYNFFNTFITLGDVWAGQSGGWKTARLRLSGTAGKSSVKLRFVFASDNFVTYEGMGVDDIKIYVPLSDDLAGLNTISVGENVECGLEQDSVTFTFNNFGTQAQSFFQVGYSINGGAPVIEDITATVQPGANFTYTFNTTFDSRDDKFDIKCWTSLLDEQNLVNDTAYYTVSHLPRPVPFLENFESQVFPDGWTIVGFPFITNFNNNSSFVLETNMWGGNPSFLYTLPRYGEINTSDTLTFDYKITEFGSGGAVPTTLSGGTKIEVQISTDCDNFQTVYAINLLTHVPATTMKKIKIGLDAYAGQAITIRFKGSWTSGDFYFDLDNINLRACAADMALTPTVVPSTNGQNGSATVNVGLGNPPYKYLWSNGATTKTVTGLPVGPVTVTVTDALGCTDELLINVGTTAAQQIEGLTALSLRPNPTSGTATLFLSFDRAVDLHVEIINLMGQRIWEAGSSYAADFSETVDLNNYPDGVYLVRLTVDGQTLTKKLIKAGN